MLDALVFEGATKRSKPNLRIGSLLYARVTHAHKDMDPELECFDAQTRKADGFGELNGSFVVRCSLKMCRRCVVVNTVLSIDSHCTGHPKYFLLPMLGALFTVETAVGMNDRVWVNAKEARHIVAIARCIEAVDPDGGRMTQEDVKMLLLAPDNI